MPPRRRRRLGSQDHNRVDPVLEAALDNEAARLHAIETPSSPSRPVTEFFNALEDALARVAEPRHLAVMGLDEELGSYQKPPTRLAVEDTSRGGGPRGCRGI